MGARGCRRVLLGGASTRHQPRAGCTAPARGAPWCTVVLPELYFLLLCFAAIQLSYIQLRRLIYASNLAQGCAPHTSPTGHTYL